LYKGKDPAAHKIAEKIERLMSNFDTHPATDDSMSVLYHNMESQLLNLITA
jgi:hypothetical protein